MKSKNRLKLAIVMVVIAIVVSFAIATFDYLRQKQFVINNHELIIKQIEESVVDSIITIDKAYVLFDKQTVEKMETKTHFLINLYEENPNFNEWNFNDLNEKIGMDIFVINKQNVVTHSNLPSDIGLDFTKCCQTLSKILDNRRNSNEIFIDRMDIEQDTGLIKMYSYQVTPDNKFIIELGYNLQSGDIFKEFNFLTSIEKFKNTYSSINDINILNLGGLALGKNVEESKISKVRRTAFKEALTKGHIITIEDNWEEEWATFRYVPYVSAYDTGSTKNKVVEIIYNDHELQLILTNNRKAFFLQLAIVLVVITVITLIIHKWVTKQVYFAYHDSLTHLKNRAAFDEYLENILLKNKNKSFSLMMIDLDNFKLVNDYLGHDKGDHVLFLVGQTIHNAVKDKGESFRLGGDEFAIVFPNTILDEAKYEAELIINEIEKAIGQEKDLNGFNITASIGICLAPEHGLHSERLYKNADVALYHAKEKGKNQYYVYHNELLTHKENNLFPINI